MKSQVTEQEDVRQAVTGAMPEGTIDHRNWWHHKNLRRMNLLMVFPLLSIFTLGYANHSRICLVPRLTLLLQL